jgi:hypothetical protein
MGDEVALDLHPWQRSLQRARNLAAKGFAMSNCSGLIAVSCRCSNQFISRTPKYNQPIPGEPQPPVIIQPQVQPQAHHRASLLVHMGPGR